MEADLRCRAYNMHYIDIKRMPHAVAAISISDNTNLAWTPWEKVTV